MMQPTIMRPLATLALVIPLAACGDDLPDDPMGMDTSLSGCGTGGSDTECTGTGSSSGSITSTTSGLDETGAPQTSSSSDDGPETVGIPDECEVSSECGRGELCVAPFDPDLGPEGKGPSECVTECVVLMDELRWCLDAAACCDPQAECTDRGYCVLPDDTGSSDDDSGSSGGDTGTGTTG